MKIFSALLVILSLSFNAHDVEAAAAGQTKSAALARSTMTNTHTTAEHFFSHYLDAYDAYSVEKIVAHYAPSVLVSGLPSGPIVMGKTQLESLFTNFLAQQRAAGVARFEWDTFGVHHFSETNAISSNIAVRFDSSNQLLGRAAATMQANKQNGQWKIVALTLHSESSLLPLTANLNEEAFQAGLKQDGRPSADKKRDATRMPATVMQFANIQPGMTVLDLVAAGGYYTEVLSHRVGSSGKVYAHNTQFVLQARNGAFQKELSQRLANNRLSNVQRLDSEFGEIDLDAQADIMTMVLNYHDFYNQPVSKRTEGLADMRSALKSGGAFLVIDSNAKPGDHDPRLHRISRDRALSEIEAAGFTLEKEGMFLRNPQDPLITTAFDKDIRGKTDRFVLLFKKNS